MMHKGRIFLFAALGCGLVVTSNTGLRAQQPANPPAQPNAITNVYLLIFGSTGGGMYQVTNDRGMATVGSFQRDASLAAWGRGSHAFTQRMRVAS